MLSGIAIARLSQKTFIPKPVSSGATFLKLFPGGIDTYGNASIAQLGGSILARLILVSNRVPTPNAGGAQRAGGLEVALAPTFKQNPGIWFGWSGKVVPRDPVSTHTVEECEDALLVNPYDSESLAAAIEQALEMPLSERRERHSAIFANLSRSSSWGTNFLRSLDQLELAGSDNDFWLHSTI
jgi:trehalose-6-phosphate synthase